MCPALSRRITDPNWHLESALRSLRPISLTGSLVFSIYYRLHDFVDYNRAARVQIHAADSSTFENRVNPSNPIRTGLFNDR